VTHLRQASAWRARPPAGRTRPWSLPLQGPPLTRARVGKSPAVWSCFFSRRPGTRELRREFPSQDFRLSTYGRGGGVGRGRGVGLVLIGVGVAVAVAVGVAVGVCVAVAVAVGVAEAAEVAVAVAVGVAVGV